MTPSSVISLPARMGVLLVLFFFMVTYHGRLVEITSRLDFVWKQQAVRELADMGECRQYNNQLLKNILPDHVAAYFLSEDRKGEVRKDGCGRKKRRGWRKARERENIGKKRGIGTGPRIRAVKRVKRKGETVVKRN